MMRLQKLVVAMAVAGALGSGYAGALGLGEVRLHSALNQPLDAEIELLQVQDLTRNEVLPNLASRVDFQRAGVERAFSLSDLNFRTEILPNGTGFIRVTSSRPIQEPFLNFLLEVHWPSGRLLREYTLLLDPPAFSEQPAQPVQPATSSPYGTQPPPRQQQNPFDNRSSQGYLPPPPAQTSQPQSRPQPQQQRPPEQQFLPVQRVVDPGRTEGQPYQSASDYRVQPDDTLWNIARKVRPGRDLSVQQTMLAIQRKNPEAFGRNNINILKQGQVLRLPDREEIEALSFREAVGEVGSQNRAWKGRLEQVDATRRGQADSSQAGQAPEGRLSIVGVDNASGQGQDLGGGNAETAALQSELALTREKLDKLSRENEELNSRLQDLDEQIATLKRLINLKDDQLASFQQGGSASSDSEDLPPERPPEPAPSAEQQAKPESQGDNSFLGFLLGNPLLLALAGLLPLGVAGGLLYRRRKRQEQDDFDEDDEVAPVQLTEGDEEDEEALALDESFEIDESILEDEEEEVVDPLDEETVQQTEDAISEADIYIAYGRFPQAAELLGKAIEAEPERSDLRLKLLEVHAENNDLDNFREALQDLEQLGDKEAVRQADGFKARFPLEAFASQPGNQATDAGGGEDAGAEQGQELEFDLDGLDLDDLELDEESAEEKPEPADSDEDDGLEFDLDDLDLGAEEAEPEASETEADGIDFQLDGLDLDTEEPAQEEAEDEFSGLDLDDLELDSGDDSGDKEPTLADDELPDLDLSDLELSDGEPENTEASIDDIEGLDDLGLEMQLDEESAKPEKSDEAVAEFDEGIPDLEAALNEDDDLDFLFDDDEASTKLDLARAYIDMGDQEGARDILNEVLESGNDEQKKEAQALLDQAG